MTDILVTAFKPFGGDEINPTELILSALPEKTDDARIVKLLLPVEFEEAPRMAMRTIMRLRPGAVVLMGQAGGRRDITPERVAINVMDASIPDNAGFKPCDMPVEEGAPAAYFSTLPIKTMVEAMRADGLLASVSNSAGTYVCNALMYSVLRGIAERGLDIPAGFVHFPFIRAQVEGREDRINMPFIELDDAIRAAEKMIFAVADSIKP